MSNAITASRPRGRPPLEHPDEPIELRQRKRAYWRKYYHSRQPIEAWMRAALHNSRRRAKAQGVLNSLTLDDVRNMIPDDMLCPILHVPLDIRNEKIACTQHSATIDRIDPDGGYTRDNTHIISNLANRGKAHMSLANLMMLGAWACKTLTNKQN